MDRYAVSFKARFESTEGDFCKEVDNWSGEYLSDLAAVLQKHIRDTYCGGRMLSVGIVVTSIYKLKSKGKK